MKNRSAENELLDKFKFNKNNYAGDIQFKKKYFIALIEADMADRSVKSNMSALKSIAFMENLFKKDVYNMDLQQYKATLKYLSKATLTALTTVKSLIDKYIAYALDNKMILSNSHPAFSLKRSNLVELLNTKKNFDRYITENEYNKLLEKLENYQDKALVILLWNNIYSGGFKAILDLTLNDLDFENNEIRYIDNKGNPTIKKLSQKDMDIIYAASKEKVYIDAIEGNCDLEENGMLLKKVVKPSQNRLVNTNVAAPDLYERFNNQIKKTLNNNYIKAIGIISSGLAYRVDNRKGKELLDFCVENGINSAHLMEVVDILKNKEKEQEVAVSKL